MDSRLKRLRSLMAGHDLDALIIAAPEDLSHTNLRYLTGFTGTSGYLVVDREGAAFLTDSRYVEQAWSQVQECLVVEHKSPYVDSLAACCPAGGGTIGFEAGKVPVRMLGEWKERLHGYEFAAADGLVESLRIVKDASEIAKMRQVASLAGQALEDALASFAPGMSERKLARDLAHAMQERGLDAPGFSFIVASGPRGSLPHAQPTDRPVEAGDLLTIDFGGALDGYLSDETVTVGIGKVASKLREIYDLVLASQAAGIAAAGPGVPASEVDRASRAVIEASPYREWCFAYGVGHGVGLDIHEEPFAAKAGSGRADRTLVPGMTLTVEPGIYIPGLGGVRLEDTLVITEHGKELITGTSKAYRAL